MTDFPAARILRASLTLLFALAVVIGAGCGRKAAAPAKKEAAPSAEATAYSSAEASAATSQSSADAQTATATPAPTPAPIPSQSAPAPQPTLGPTDAAASWAYLKDMYEKDGFWYVVVDYLQVVGPEETLHFLNENPRLRTFPLAEGAQLLLLKSPGSPDYKSVSVPEFKTFQSQSGDEVIEVTPSGGWATQLKQWWAP